MNRAANLLLAACLVAAPALAGDDRAKGPPDVPRGQTVSGCNHQANDLELKGRDRKRFVKRCIERGGEGWSAEDNRRSCRERAQRAGLRGADEDRFVQRCREYRRDVWGDQRVGDDRRDDDDAGDKSDRKGEGRGNRADDDEPFNPRDKGTTKRKDGRD